MRPILFVALFMLLLGCEAEQTPQLVNPTPDPPPAPTVVEPATEHPHHELDTVAEATVPTGGEPDALRPGPLPLLASAGCPKPSPMAGMDAEMSAAYSYANPANADVCAVASGAWSNPAIWSTQRVPTTNQNVWLPAGSDVLYDLDSPARMGWINVDMGAKLSWDTTQLTTLIFDTLLALGELEIGRAGAPASANLVVGDYGPLNPTADTELVTRGILTHGPVTMVGEIKTPFVRTTVHPRKGDTKLTLAAVPIGWQPGDEIALAGAKTLCPTIMGIQTCQHEDEKRVIQSLSNNVVTLDKALTLDHVGPLPELSVHVANLTRSIRVYNENPNAAVSRRGHVMVMGPSANIQYVELKNQGRTNKAVTSKFASSFTPLTATSNVQGRYSLHLHKTGIGAAYAHTVNGNAVNGSAGWGIATHDGTSNLTNNVAYDFFGAGFVTENDNETGYWGRNIAIRGIGRRPCLTKNFNGTDFWFCGTGFAMTRMIEADNNVCAGTPNSECFSWMTRRPTPANVPKEALSVPEVSMDVALVNDDFPPILNFKNNEAYGARYGLKVTKAGPHQQHPLRTYLTDFTTWNVLDYGLDQTYTGRYTIIRPRVVGVLNTKNAKRCGINFGKNSMDMVVINPIIENSSRGYCNFEGTTFGTTWPRDFTLINPKCTNCGTVTVGVMATKSGSFAQGAVFKEKRAHPAGQYSKTVAATVTDGLGVLNIGDGTFDVIKYYGDNTLERLKTQGYCGMPNGSKAVKLKVPFSSRLEEKVLFYDMPLALPNKTYFNSALANAANNGPC